MLVNLININELPDRKTVMSGIDDDTPIYSYKTQSFIKYRVIISDAERYKLL